VEKAQVGDDYLLTMVCNTARELTGADGACIVLREGEQVHYLKECAIAPLWAGQKLPISDCLSGWSILHNEPVVIPDIDCDPRVPPEYYRPTFVRSLAICPIEGDNPIGALGVYWARPYLATPEQLQALKELAQVDAWEAICAREQHGHRLSRGP
jgi:GAF domain-containing protein